MKGICFKEPLFSATIEGRKTQTRRIIKHIGNEYHYGTLLCDWALSGIPTEEDNGTWSWELQTDVDDSADFIIKPRYKVGEIIYLKEPYAYMSMLNYEPIAVYKYGKTPAEIAEYDSDDGCSGLVSDWKNKLFMPADAARYFIKTTAVRAERLQDISDEDCIKEGIYISNADDPSNGLYFNGMPRGIGYLTSKEAYSSLIDKINGKGTWKYNPYVWVYDYELITK